MGVPVRDKVLREALPAPFETNDTDLMDPGTTSNTLFTAGVSSLFTCVTPPASRPGPAADHCGGEQGLAERGIQSRLAGPRRQSRYQYRFQHCEWYFAAGRADSLAKRRDSASDPPHKRMKL